MNIFSINKDLNFIIIISNKLIGLFPFFFKRKKLSIFVKLAEGDENKVEPLKKIISNEFDLSPRGIREMLKLNNPIYEVTSAYGHFGRKPTNTGEFSWEKTDKAGLFKLQS